MRRLTERFLNDPSLRLTTAEIVVITDLDIEDAEIVVATLKDAGFLIEQEGRLMMRSIPAA